jgi:hypothetical protein
VDWVCETEGSCCKGVMFLYYYFDLYKVVLNIDFNIYNLIATYEQRSSILLPSFTLHFLIICLTQVDHWHFLLVV